MAPCSVACASRIRSPGIEGRWLDIHQRRSIIQDALRWRPDPAQVNVEQIGDRSRTPLMCASIRRRVQRASTHADLDVDAVLAQRLGADLHAQAGRVRRVHLTGRIGREVVARDGHRQRLRPGLRQG